MKNKQFEFAAVNEQESTTIICTAPNERYAKAQVENYYGPEWIIGEVVAVYPPHKIAGEIDAADMTEDDYQYVLRILGKA